MLWSGTGVPGCSQVTRKTTALLMSLCLVAAGLGIASVAGADQTADSTSVTVTQDVTQEECGVDDYQCSDGGSGGDDGDDGDCGVEDPACPY